MRIGQLAARLLNILGAIIDHLKAEIVPPFPIPLSITVPCYSHQRPASTMAALQRCGGWLSLNWMVTNIH
jgi:hypothetical protein